MANQWQFSLFSTAEFPCSKGKSVPEHRFVASILAFQQNNREDSSGHSTILELSHFFVRKLWSSKMGSYIYIYSSSSQKVEQIGEHSSKTVENHTFFDPKPMKHMKVLSPKDIWVINL